MNNFVNINSEKRKILDRLHDEISTLKLKQDNYINELRQIDLIINEKQTVINELIGLPLSVEQYKQVLK